MNEFVFQVALVFLPGLAWTVIVDTLTTVGERRSTFSTMLRAFGFGLAAYFIYFLFYFGFCRCRGGAWPTLLDGVTSAGIDNLRILRPRDILVTTLLSPVFAIAWTFAANHKWFLRIMQTLRVTRKFGDESVWDYTFNMSVPAVEFVNIRDFENKIIYAGFVKAFSEGAGPREILLECAEVYDLITGQKLYQMPLLYLSRKPESLHVEYPYEPPEKQMVLVDNSDAHLATPILPEATAAQNDDAQPQIEDDHA